MADFCTITGNVGDVAGIAVGGACIEVSADTPQTVQGSQKSGRPVMYRSGMDGDFTLILVQGANVRVTITDPDTKSVVYDESKTVPTQLTQDFDTWT